MARSVEGKLLHVPLVEGINQSFDESLAPPGTLTVCSGMRARGDGILEPKYGTTSVTPTVATNRVSLTASSSVYTENPTFATKVGDANIVGTTAGQVFGLDRQRVFHLVGSAPTAIPKKAVGHLMAATPSNAVTSACPAVARVGSTTAEYVMVVGVESTWLTGYIATAEGVVLMRLQPANITASKVQLLTLSDTDILMVYQNGTAIRGVVYTINTGVVTVGTDTSLATLSSSSAHWDTTNAGTSTWYLTYQSGASTMTVARYSVVSVSSARNISVTGTVPVSCWVTPGGTNLWFGWYDNPTVSGDVKYQVVQASSLLTDVKTATTIVSAANIYGAPRFGKYRDQMSGASTADASLHAFCIFPRRSSNGERATMTCIAWNNSAPTSPVACTGTFPVSKPDNYHRWWALVTTNSTNCPLQRYCLLRLDDSGTGLAPRIELSTPQFATLGSQSASEVTLHPGWFHSQAINDTSAGNSYFALPQNLVDISNAPLAQIVVYQYQTGSQFPWMDVEQLGLTAVTAGQPTEMYGQPADALGTVSAISGRRSGGSAECGFVHAPTILTAAQASGTGVGPGTYIYKAVYEWIDVYGRRHQSAPSAPVSVTVTVDDQVDLTITTLDASQRQQMLYCYIRLYRTLAGGQPYLLLPDVIASSDSSGVTSFSDTRSDSSIQNNTSLYTDGGVQPHDLAPSCRFVANSEDRLWCGGLWDPNIIQASKTFVPGEPVQFSNNEAFQVVLPAPCTGLAYQDGAVIAFTNSGIYVIGGDGPTDQGFGTFAPPRCISSDVGCIDHRSVVEASSGVYFQSARGIYRLPRGMGQIEFVGRKIQNALHGTEGTAGVILGAVAADNRQGHNVLFGVTTSPDVIAYSQIYVYDPENDRWYIDSGIYSGVVLGVWDTVSLGSVVRGVASPVYVRTFSSTPSIVVETPNERNDSVTQTVTTAWIKPFGPGGYGKVKHIVVAVDFTGFTGSGYLKLTYEYDNNIAAFGLDLEQEAVWTINDGTLKRTQYRQMTIKGDKCTAFRVTLTNRHNSQVLGCYKIISITAEVEDSGGIRQLSASESA